MYEEHADPDPPQLVPPGVPLGTALPMTEKAQAEVKRPAAEVKRSAEAEAAAAGVINVSPDEKRREEVIGEHIREEAEKQLKRYAESQEGDCQEGCPDCQAMRDAEREMQPPGGETLEEYDERIERELNEDLDEMEFQEFLAELPDEEAKQDWIRKRNMVKQALKKAMEEADDGVRVFLQQKTEEDYGHDSDDIECEPASFSAPESTDVPDEDDFEMFAEAKANIRQWEEETSVRKKKEMEEAAAMQKAHSVASKRLRLPKRSVKWHILWHLKEMEKAQAEKEQDLVRRSIYVRAGEKEQEEEKALEWRLPAAAATRMEAPPAAASSSSWQN